MIYVNTICYAAVFIACMAHLNRVHGMTLIRVLAFAFTAAGSAGSALELWVPTHEESMWWHTMFHIGVAMMAVLHFGLDRRKAVHDPQFIERRFERTL